jgi:uncharacterized cupredoxin-like copper-binding protein
MRIETVVKPESRRSFIVAGGTAVWVSGPWLINLSHAHTGSTHPETAPRSGAKLVKKRAPEQHAWGIAGDRRKVTKTVTITALDTMRFSPDKVNVREGETVRIVLKNVGTMLHELVIGTPDVLQEHAKMMIKFPNMEHDEPYMVHVNPGKSGEIVWKCNRAGSFEYACLIAGHYAAGMKGVLTVKKA